MCAIVRGILTRISPLCWLAAAGLAVAWVLDPDLNDLAPVVVVTGAAVAGTMSGAITATAGHDKALLMSALLANRPPAAAADPHHPARDLHAV